MSLSSALPVQPVAPRHQRKISSSTEFKELTKKDAIFQLSLELEKLSLTSSNPTEKESFDIEVSGFKDLYQKFIVGSGPVQWEKIEPLPGDAVLDYTSLKDPIPEAIRDMLNKLVVVKLNGGLGKSTKWWAILLSACIFLLLRNLNGLRRSQVSYSGSQ